MRRATLLPTTAAAAGLLVARALDGLGLLPWVHETDQVRRAAADPRWTALGLVGCLVVGRLAAAVVRRAPWLAVAVLVGGQVGLVVLLEEAARRLAGAPEGGGDSGLLVACLVQLLLALVAVGATLLVLRLVPPQWPAWSRVGVAGTPVTPYRSARATGLLWRPRGRAPPVGC